MTTPQRCGRLGDRAPHDYTLPARVMGRPARTYACNGRCVTEGGWGVHADVERADLAFERGELAADRQREWDA